LHLPPNTPAGKFSPHRQKFTRTGDKKHLRPSKFARTGTPEHAHRQEKTRTGCLNTRG
jgi:hypothetical protein